jgi:hypothetical protein
MGIENEINALAALATEKLTTRPLTVVLVIRNAACPVQLSEKQTAHRSEPFRDQAPVEAEL